MGNAFLNYRAIPFPITPTVLTVVTNASAFEHIIFPVVNHIISCHYFPLFPCPAIEVFDRNLPNNQLNTNGIRQGILLHDFNILAVQINNFHNGMLSHLALARF